MTNNEPYLNGDTLTFSKSVREMPTPCVLTHSCVFARALLCITGKNSIEMTRRLWRIALLHHSSVIASRATRSAINFCVPPSPRQSRAPSCPLLYLPARGRVSSLLAAIAPLIAPRSYFSARETVGARARARAPPSLLRRGKVHLACNAGAAVKARGPLPPTSPL